MIKRLGSVGWCLRIFTIMACVTLGKLIFLCLNFLIHKMGKTRVSVLQNCREA